MKKREFYFTVIGNHIILFKIFIKLQYVLIKSSILFKCKKKREKIKNLIKSTMGQQQQ